MEIADLKEAEWFNQEQAGEDADYFTDSAWQCGRHTAS